MSKRTRKWVPVVALVLALAAATAAFCLSDVAYRASTYNGRPAGDVLVNGQLVMSLRTSAGGLSPVQRAQSIATRLQELPESDFTADRVQVRAVRGGRALFINNEGLVTITSQEARAHMTSPQVLAEVWRSDLVQTVTGEVPPPVPPTGPGGPYADWVGQSQKWVPILSIEQSGARIGAAQVSGPTAKVDQTVGVAQLGLTFRNLARVTVYVPVSDLSLSSIKRVQGVSVWAIGDIRIIRF